MKAIIWKELRENFKWALLALLALTVAEFYTLSLSRTSISLNAEVSLFGSAFLMASSFGCTLIGAALGTVQILPELRRDQWAALLHRPASRQVIFLGKAAAGLLLYLFAAALPFLFSVVYAAIPGEFAAPFISEMVFPGLSDLIFGVAAYFAALSLCLHRGKWWGMRGLIALSVGLLFVIQIEGFVSGGLPGLFAFPLLVALALSAIAWSAILSNDGQPRRPWIGRASYLLLGWLGAWLILALLVLLLQQLPGNTDKNTVGVSQFVVSQDHQIFFGTSDGENEVLTDMQGKPVTDERFLGNSQYENTCNFNFLHIGSDSETINSNQEKRRNSGANIQKSPSRYDSPEIWFLLIHENYWIGYDRLTRRCVGICDRDGFKPAGTPPKPFPEPLQAGVFGFSESKYFWSGSEIYRFDPINRILLPLFNSGNDAILGVTDLYREATPKVPQRIAIALSSGMRFLDDHGTPLFSLSPPPSTEDVVTIAGNRSGDRYYLQWGSSFWYVHPSSNKPPILFLDEIDASGNLLNTYRHPYELHAVPARWTDSLSIYIAPVLPSILGALHQKSASMQEEMSSPANFFIPSLPARKLKPLFILAPLLAIITWFLARRVGFTLKKSAGWAFFVCCFGLPGILIFRLASGWPTQMPCPHCGKPRAVKDPTCSNCQGGWPLPKLNGTEIFEPL